MFFLLVLAGRVFGAGFGFVLGATTLFASALITGGVGPWLPFQMFGAAWVGWGAGMLPPMRGRREVVMLAVYGALAGLAYGLLLNLSFWPFATGLEGGLSFVPGAPVAENLHRFLVFSLATSLGWDLGRALTNFALIMLTGPAILGALRRAARRAAFEEPIEFKDLPEHSADALPLHRSASQIREADRKLGSGWRFEDASRGRELPAPRGDREGAAAPDQAHHGPMSSFDSRPGLRWAVPAGAGAAILVGSLLAPLAASADAGLEPRTAQELLVALQSPSTDTVSGTVTTQADLGLPDLPMGMTSSGSTAGLAMGENTLRVWADGPTRQRLALLGRTSEQTVIRNGEQVWVWSSADATADSYTLPEPADLPERDGKDATLPTDLPSTPQEAATMALEALDPTTEVTTSGVGTVAGRDTYELLLTPRDDQTLVARVALAMDAETSVPLRVRVYSAQQSDPAFEVGFTSVDFGTPDAALFDFTPPPGATVTEHAAGDPAEWDGKDRPASQDSSGEPPTVVGEGWSTIVIADLPADGLADLAEQGSREESDRPGPHASDDASTALALIGSLPQTSGDWGTGRVLRGTLFSAILTDDGRLAIGAVSPDALSAALSDVS